ncbi:MAG: chorismate synthase [Kiritimatiellia bacterium]
MHLRPPFGHHLRLAIRGASHAPCIRFTLENFPAGFAVDGVALKAFMERRAPGRDDLSTSRREPDEIEFRRGVADGLTTGGLIEGRIRNTDARPADYGVERTIPRPGHADFPQWVEAGRIPTGGGTNSGRLTAALCAAGGLCLQFLESRGIRIAARIESVHGNAADPEAEIRAAKDDRDSVGGLVACSATGMPPGIGGALFDGIETSLAGALFAIPGVKGVEFGNGFACAALRGSENNDAFTVEDGVVSTTTNRQGGLLGGRTSGMPVEFRIVLRPTPTLPRPQPSVDLATMTPATCTMGGRHDPCIVRRAVPVVEAVTALVLADAILAAEAASPRICLTLVGPTLEEDLAQYRAQRYFTDMVELRVDLLADRDASAVAAFPARIPVPVVLTFRRKADGGAYDGDEATRETFFRTVLREASTPFAYVDFESDFRPDGLAAAARDAGTRIIRSLHDFTGPVEDIVETCRQLRGATGDIPKIAFLPRSMADVARLFEQARDFTGMPHILCAMGPRGLASRVLAVRTHSLLTYASVGGLDGLGHVTPQELVRTYRIRSITPEAELTGVTGWPLAATRSPEIHNAAHAAADRDAIMVPFPAETAAEAVAFMRAMGMRGLAVTMPHKEAILAELDEIAPEAARLGAVNTVLQRRGRLVGHNTDDDGFAEAISAFVGRPLAGLRTAMLGAGGAAKAAVAALERLGATVEVFHRRTPGPGFDLFVNATPVDPIPDYRFTGGELVYDMLYVPEVPPLLARAAAAGCRTENGFSMLLAQARRQRMIWEEEDA